MCAEVSHSLPLAMLYLFFLLFPPFPFLRPLSVFSSPVSFLFSPFSISLSVCIRVENGASEIIPDGSV